MTQGPDGSRVRSHLEEAWCEVFGIRVSDDSNFFDLGGDSLAAAAIATRLADALPDAHDEIDLLVLTEIFDHPTLGALASRLSNLLGAPQR